MKIDWRALTKRLADHYGGRGRLANKMQLDGLDTSDDVIRSLATRHRINGGMAYDRMLWIYLKATELGLDIPKHEK